MKQGIMDDATGIGGARTPESVNSTDGTDSCPFLPPSWDNHPDTLEFVAMLSLDQTKIIEVFPNQAAVAKNRQFKIPSPICWSLMKGTQSNGRYFKMWYDCSNDLKDDFLSRSTLPDKVVPGGKPVVQLHPITRQVVRVHASLTDIANTYHTSSATIRKAINSDFIVRGYRWAWKS